MINEPDRPSDDERSGGGATAAGTPQQRPGESREQPSNRPPQPAADGLDRPTAEGPKGDPGKQRPAAGAQPDGAAIPRNDQSSRF
jgi:hypothetical protein